MKAVVFGLFETGLGVIRSLGKKGISVIGIDYKKDIAWYSRFVKPHKCPHPLLEENEFVNWIHSTFSESSQLYPVFFTSDDFLSVFFRNRDEFCKYFLFNHISLTLFERISDKYSQIHLATQAGIDVPSTWMINRINDLKSIPFDVNYPLFIKGQEVNTWRRKIHKSIKGFRVNDARELDWKVTDIINKNVPLIIQEVIQGPDTNHFKYCSYTKSTGEVLAEFTLRKIRQNPIHFGVGAVVESEHYPKLLELGRKLFRGIGYRGIGSAEFKLDEKDGKLKLIEINPRYWQQNYLSTACGQNFPYIHYLDLTGQSVIQSNNFQVGIKWVNRYMDLDSFFSYRKEGTLSFSGWRRSLRGKKVYADFTWNDPIPLLFEIGFGRKLVKVPWFIMKRLFK